MATTPSGRTAPAASGDHEVSPRAEETNYAEHQDLHSEQGARRGEHPGRATNPTVKVSGLAWLEFEKRDLDTAERFARDFGFAVHARTDDALHLRGARAGAPCMVIRRGRTSRFVGPVFAAAEAGDLDRLARAAGGSVQDRKDLGAGRTVRLTDPSGVAVQVVHGVEELPELPLQEPLQWNVAGGTARTNATQRPEREPSRVERLGHVVMASRVFARNLDWYLQHLGLIVSDFLYLEGRRDRGPTMAFIRCDRGSVPSDHHTLAMLLHPKPGYVHSAYEVADLDALAAGGEYLREQGRHHSWGIGRHIQGSQIFDYWRDPDHVMVEHYTDGDLFDSSVETGWAPMSASGLRQWGPRPTRDFIDATPGPELARTALEALREDNELDVRTLLALARAMSK